EKRLPKGGRFSLYGREHRPAAVAAGDVRVVGHPRDRRVRAAVRAVRAQLEAVQAEDAAVAARQVGVPQPWLLARRALEAQVDAPVLHQPSLTSRAMKNPSVP